MTDSPAATLTAFAVIKQAELLELRVPPYPTRARQAARLLLPRAVGADLGLIYLIGHFAVPLKHFIPDLLLYSAAVFSKVTIGFIPKEARRGLYDWEAFCGYDAT